MNNVYLLQHVHRLPGGHSDVKTIGIYRSRNSAEDAIGRVKSQPGFADHPRLLDPAVEDEEEGFYIDEYPLDADHWTEGYVTV